MLECGLTTSIAECWSNLGDIALPFCDLTMSVFFFWNCNVADLYMILYMI